MIIVNLKGGLGNQMFQYAFGRKLSFKNDDVLKLDTAGLARANEVGDIYRPFSLQQFNILENVATAGEVKRLKYPYGVFSKAWRYVSLHFLHRTHTVFEPKALEMRGDIFLDGYWQSPMYFNDIRDVLLKEFTLKDPLPEYGQSLLRSIDGTTSVSIHVRRGDYAQNRRVLHEFGLCSVEYYKNAIAHITEQHPNARFFIFSDDIEWVQRELGLSENAVYVSNNELTDAAELYLMSRCKHNIIANSSFSWWGAWLNANPKKIVVAPEPWFDTATYDKNLIPASWIRLSKT